MDTTEPPTLSGPACSGSPQAPCSALEACKKAVSEQLMAALNGSDKTARTDDGFIRWGLVEKRLHNLIEGYWPNTKISNG